MIMGFYSITGNFILFFVSFFFLSPPILKAGHENLSRLASCECHQRTICHGKWGQTRRENSQTKESQLQRILNWFIGRCLERDRYQIFNITDRISRAEITISEVRFRFDGTRSVSTNLKWMPIDYKRNQSPSYLGKTEFPLLFVPSMV